MKNINDSPRVTLHAGRWAAGLQLASECCRTADLDSVAMVTGTHQGNGMGLVVQVCSDRS